MTRSSCSVTFRTGIAVVVVAAAAVAVAHMAGEPCLVTVVRSLFVLISLSLLLKQESMMIV